MPSRRLLAAGLAFVLPLLAACQKDAVEFGIIPTTTGFPIEITSLTSPVRVGDNATMVVTTEPEARCETDLDYEVKNPPQQPVRLNSRRSGNFDGVIDVEWRIQVGTVAPQHVTITVTCTKEGRAGVVTAVMEVIT